MTDKARELLERAIEVLDFDRGLDADDLMEEIRAYLAEPEVKREPLSEETIRWEYEKTEKSLRAVTLTEYGWFCAGAQWADEANRTEYDAM